jgi:hypothetical protein
MTKARKGARNALRPDDWLLRRLKKSGMGG